MISWYLITATFPPRRSTPPCDTGWLVLFPSLESKLSVKKFVSE